MLWFGWLGFNAGSAFGANLRAVMAAWNTNITAAFVSTFTLISHSIVANRRFDVLTGRDNMVLARFPSGG
jgi:ammonia channel protein AmtB